MPLPTEIKITNKQNPSIFPLLGCSWQQLLQLPAGSSLFSTFGRLSQPQVPTRLAAAGKGAAKPAYSTPYRHPFTRWLSTARQLPPARDTAPMSKRNPWKDEHTQEIMSSPGRNWTSPFKRGLPGVSFYLHSFQMSTVLLQAAIILMCSGASSHPSKPFTTDLQ